MSRIQLVQPEKATGEARELLAAVNSKMGRTPNLAKALAASPAALKAYLQFSGALAGGALSASTREQIALTVAEANSCNYCVAAHCAIGASAGLTPDQICDSREGLSRDAKTDAILKFSRKIVDERGQVSDEDVQKVKRAGVNDAELAEIVANVVVNIFTNYFNHVAGTEIDFPKPETVER